MKYQILEEQIILDKFLKVYEARVSYDTYTGNEPLEATRQALDRGNAVAVLLYEKDTQQFLFVEQYRYPAARHDEPWLLEIPAGHVDDGEDPKQAAIREVREEIGFEIEKLELINQYFPSPGMLSEQISLYYGEVCSNDQIHQGGGKEDEQEDILLVKMHRDEAKRKLAQGMFNTSVCLISLQWYFLNHAD
ncbi:NUDIX domain-containing protein [Nonlabens xiamenensis]|uniref:NUDIX domain-containing protein n=1 Tax=Nonlabens xiamenensis TaxID=2341043 RepID=UPI000F61450D|nr:NUDIX hydrolase [Nonlabens xiamenensis]